jgi:5-formyltetrahydrofolate cyclo-ligase
MCLLKPHLRKEAAQRRDGLDNRAARSEEICARVSGLSAYIQARVLHCYLPVRSEVDTRPLLADALASGKEVVVPVVQRETGELLHSRLLSLHDDELHAGCFGVHQPRTLCLVDAAMCEVLIVPLLAFDRAGHRLGYGKGYYDRLLAMSRAPAVGVAFAVQEMASLPHDPHDQPLDWIVTEHEVIESIKVPTTGQSPRRGSYRG